MKRFDADRPAGRELTCGNMAKLSEAAAEARALLAKLDSDIADLDRRLAKLEQEKPVARALIAEA